LEFSYADYCQGFLQHTVPLLKTFGEPDDVCAQREMFAALASFLARVIAFLRHDDLADSR
jgi:hypothetical protein